MYVNLRNSLMLMLTMVNVVSGFPAIKYQLIGHKSIKLLENNILICRYVD